MKQLKIAARLFLFFTLLIGLIYPLLITGTAQLLFPSKANGSLVSRNGKIIGSELIGQQFSDSTYFHSRPSATNYNTLPSGGSNMGPTNKELRRLKEERDAAFIASNQLQHGTQVPAEMLFASGSGLDPHISKQAALLQVDRVARVRGFGPEKTQQLWSIVLFRVEKPQYSLFGEERVNVLMLNLDLDNLK
jgi:K+-transporting ATPase ATPase C chain